MEKKEDKKTNTELKEQDGIHKITITKEAERSLGEVVQQINDGYAGGKASRTEVASWVLMQFRKGITAIDIRTMRLEFLDEISLLELSLKHAKESGKLSPDLKKLLLQQSGLLDEPIRKGSKGKSHDEIRSEIATDSI